MKAKSNLKKLILALLLMVAASTISYAQCDKTDTITSSTTYHLDDKGVVERTKDEETVITFNKTNITIAPGGEDHVTSGPVKSYTCNWTTPFKVGKTVITAVLTDGGEDINATITIEGTDGKVTVTFEADKLQGKKIQVVANKFE
ncbi:hypothetical protein [Mucilaginibacter sp.]|jgi:hypothetical protein|uniref:hypothetical protein n=1 Tax=Mucilaginibacter sp. TaxID=1882438 RepID=UPI003564F005